jgi:hypothetical protein
MEGFAWGLWNHAGNVEMPFAFSDVFHAVPNNFTFFLHPWPQYQLF